MKTDIEIAREAKLLPITEVAAKLGIADPECYGRYKAKVSSFGGKKGKVILVTAINPTPAGEGKTTVSIGLADGMARIGKNVCLALREPSLGPVFGIKGGATGGGRAQIAPMEDINLHFNGDFHAITSANNLLSAMIDNHIFQGNALGIENVTWHRCLDLNDRSLRSVRCGIGYNERDDHFDITAASEVMAVFCLAKDFADLKKRLGDIVIGTDRNGKDVTARMLKADEAMAILLKEAIKPNLVQTLEGTPAFVHGGPFANIAHGCNSVIATKTAMSYADYVVTEAGFGADLGAEKFFDIKCRTAGIAPSCVVLVATVRGLKYNGGVPKAETGREDLAALEKGASNLMKHIENVTGVFGMPCVVAINRFVTDTEAEIKLLERMCAERGADCVLADVWAKGGEGAEALAEAVCGRADESKAKLKFSYDLSESIKDKIADVATKVYGARGVKFTEEAERTIARLEKSGECKGLPVCIAKTQYSLSDDQTKLGRPTDFDITVREVYYRAGAGFVVAVTGKILLMPGLGKTPAAEGMTIDTQSGEIKGLF
ncbi:MAG TPA: formate--tetrahydrofolate ligase [Candidatus Protoclostridium stercorigallinarum]|uniref:Formate--tetrahydrofolate ligase n=1 Tax=Candidatus Protoclostridium stercorigallinarum TaxID=2838741 RepID=A0A9D1TQJ1_9FIRM|nr:formate--tetrahydrofolate ligase [Candidatus Protoclostridium stercorigallinarum]